jgi:asparagine synthase (glutamine-hydrolysing)
VPLGLLLSGGIDSNIIRHLSTKINYYFCGGFENDPDIIFCKKLKKENKLKIDICEISTPQFIKKFKGLIKLRSEPLSVPNEVMLSIIGSRAKKKKIKVLLSGEGADEFFAGYDRIYRWAKYTNSFSVEKFCEYYCYNRINSVNLKKIESFFNSIINLSNFEKVRAFFIKYHLPILLRRLDFSLMSAGIEGREPLISKEIFYESLKYKSNEIIDKKHGKKPLRNFLINFMGKEFSYRKKIGFPVDLKKIFKQPTNNTETNYDLWFKKNLEEIKKL